jgi:orotate phosphoribosyltransferase
MDGDGRFAQSRGFTDRADAGRVLGGHLQHLAGREDVVVLGLPRGGVPVAHEVAAALAVPMDVFADDGRRGEGSARQARPRA